MSRAVLVVDDDQFIRRLVATTLEDVSGFELHEAADGVEALELARATRPGDRLPGRRHAAHGRHRRLPAAARAIRGTAQPTIVMLTAADGDQAVQRMAEDAGADLFLTKPFSPLDLLRLVDRLGASTPPV